VITVTTAYPFEDVIVMNVTSANGPFPLSFRIPQWCTRPTLTVGRTNIEAKPDANGFVRVSRTWESGDVIKLTLPAELRASKRLTFANGREHSHWNGKAPWSGQNATSKLSASPTSSFEQVIVSLLESSSVSSSF
jgi:DUF1680 family protein